MSSVSRSVGRPVARSVLAGQLNTLASIIKSLFANNEQGFAYDPNDLTTLYQDAAGTIPVTAAGQPVGLMLDKSGRNNHAYQTTSASRPILRKNAVTGANYLEFDGVDDSLQINLPSINTPFSSIHALETTKLAATTQPILASGVGGYLYSLDPNSFGVQQAGGTPQHTLSRLPKDTLTHIYDSNGVYLKSNSAEGRKTDLVLANPYSNENPKFIAAFSATGANYAGMNYYVGFFIARTLTTGEEANLRILFNKRLGVTLNV